MDFLFLLFAEILFSLCRKKWILKNYILKRYCWNHVTKYEILLNITISRWKRVILNENTKKLAYFCVLKIEVRRNASSNCKLCIFNFVFGLQFLEQRYILQILPNAQIAFLKIIFSKPSFCRACDCGCTIMRFTYWVFCVLGGIKIE